MSGNLSHALRPDRTQLLLNLALLTAMNAVVYALQLEETNAYAGFEPIAFDVVYFAHALPAMLFIAMLMPVGTYRPSDFFQLLYGLFVPLPYAMFHSVGGHVPALSFLLNVSVLCLPMLAIRFSGAMPLRISTTPLVSHRVLECGIAGICIAVSIAAVLLSPSAAGFDLEDGYTRRLEGREIYAPGSMLSYASSIALNGLAPYLAFLGGLTRRRWLIVVAAFTVLAFFYAVGLKAPLAFVLLAFLVGVALRQRRPQLLYGVIFGAFGLAFALFLLEFAAEGYSLLSAEFIFRRIFPVPAHVLHGYFDLIFERADHLWSPWSGVTAPEGVSYLIGNLYFDSEIANVNSSAFVVALASGGVPLFLAIIGLACGVLGLLDAIYRATGDASCMYVSFVFALLLTEQAATTALVSSGVGVLIALLFVSRAYHAPAALPAAGRNSLARPPRPVPVP